MAGAFGLPEISPQMSSLSYGGPTPYLDRATYIEEQANYLPQLRAQERQEQMFDEQMRLNREARRDARTDANTTLGMKGATLGYQAYNSPTVRKYGKVVLDALKPKPVVPVGDFGTTPGLAEPIREASAGLGVSDVGGNWYDGLAAKSDAAAPTMAAPASTGFSGILPTIGGEGLAASAGNFAIKAGIPALANMAIERSNMGEFMHDKVGGGEKEWDDAASSITSFALGGPVGLGLNVARIGVREFGKKNCIIVTAAHGLDSDEVRVARTFRDKECSKAELRGYYWIADRIVPLMEAHEDVKEFYRETLVAPLIAYAKWYLGETREKPDALAFGVVKNFRQSCIDAGATMKEYVRSNGEII